MAARHPRPLRHMHLLPGDPLRRMSIRQSLTRTRTTCRKHNGWVLLIWKSSSMHPPLANSFKGFLPDHSRRRSTNSCVSDGEQALGPANVTHHFHAYERAVDARRLTHPFNASEWEHEERSKLRHRRMTLRGDDPTTATAELVQAAVEVEREDDEGDLLDLYVCCQCSFYVIASHVIPGVISVKLLEDLVKNKVENPPLDKSGELAALIALEMILMIIENRVDDQPNQVDRMREAVSVIAEMRNSDRLRKFLETGSDPGETVPATRQDWPRGLNQLGNTCYLNSLLQYFYTIKDLRDAVAPLLNSSRKTMDEDKLTDDDLKRHRVGGRLVTRKEILRSKKFVSELAELFWHLEHADIASVTPTMELAKLALVTSKEEEDDIEQTATDSSNDTDATLVEDAPALCAGPVAGAGTTRTDTGSPVGSPGASSSSVLGKRARDKEADVGSRMSIDSVTDHDNFVIILSKSPDDAAGPSGLSASPGAGVATDVEMKDAEATAQSGAKPPLPQRKTSESVMMFGRQHDVSECMDNCVFQIETALLKFDGMDESEDGKSSVVKRLFYGTLRQRLIAPRQEGVRAMSTHDSENVFSILPVSVSDEGYDIYDGLSSYFHSTAQLDSNTLSMEITLVDLPPVLQIQLQRVQWDRETGQSWKSQAYVKFEETICLDRFLDSANPDKRARSKDILSELSKRHDRIDQLKNGQHTTHLTSALGNTCDILKGLQETIHLPELDDQLLSDIRAEHLYVNDELDNLYKDIASLKQELEDLWSDKHEAVYELTSVFIHRGATPQWGHYFFYLRHLPENPDSWFKYNDSEVSVVSKEEVLANTTGSTANPYMLVFVRKGSDMISTVKRCDPMTMTLDDA
ncbi:hypothetical protein EI94DRAFT_1834394 [Lactarius quietus]|nr:hypothetical protein EI94DRAFT_1834394 [Lactarius quietus]